MFSKCIFIVDGTFTISIFRLIGISQGIPSLLFGGVGPASDRGYVYTDVYLGIIKSIVNG